MNRSRGGLLLLVPALVVFTLFFAVPLVALLVSSFFQYERSLGTTLPGLTIANYESIASDKYTIDVLVRTLRLAVVTTLLLLCIGYPLAYWMARQSGRRRTYILFVLLTPVLVVEVVRAFGWVVILGSNGVLDSFLQSVGLSSASGRYLYSEPAVILGLVHVNMPFMVLAIYASLQNFDWTLARAAASLGASARRTFLWVTLPLSLPGVVSGCLLVFTLVASAFTTPAVLGGSRVPVMSYSIFVEIYTLNDWNYASALSVVLLVTVGLITAISLRLIQGRRYRTIFG